MAEKDLASGLQKLTAAVERLADRFAPAADDAVLDRYHAFRCSDRDGRLVMKGVAHPDPVRFSELRGIDETIVRLRENTAQFLGGLPCNHVLLYGPRGTGKSSAVKALFNEYRGRGLRIVELPRDALFHVTDVADIVRGRSEHFIVFCDDLSFEEDETSYRQIKTILEGGIEARPINLLIYATSNRRHLMPEKTEDNQAVLADGELHPSETIEEKLSLSDRFGLRLGMQHFDIGTYLDIVKNYATLRRLRLPAGELRELAVRWSLEHGSYSGRVARQFIDDLEGRVRLAASRPSAARRK